MVVWDRLSIYNRGHSTIILTVFQCVCVCMYVCTACRYTLGNGCYIHLDLTRSHMPITLSCKIDEITLEPGLFPYLSHQSTGSIENDVVEQHLNNSNYVTPLKPTRKSTK